MLSETQNKLYKLVNSKILKPISSFELCNDIGVDSDTVYIADLTTVNNCLLMTDFIGDIDERHLGKKVIFECDLNTNWAHIHGDLDEYLQKVRNNLSKYFE